MGVWEAVVLPYEKVVLVCYLRVKNQVGMSWVEGVVREEVLTGLRIAEMGEEKASIP